MSRSNEPDTDRMLANAVHREFDGPSDFNCRICGEDFIPRRTTSDQSACESCVCVECGDEIGNGCAGFCQKHTDQHLTDEGICEMCEEEVPCMFCNATGKYVGLHATRDCYVCKGSGRVAR